MVSKHKENSNKLSYSWFKWKTCSFFNFGSEPSRLFQIQLDESQIPVFWFRSSKFMKTSKFRKTVQIVVILLSRLFGRKDGSTFPDKWIPIYQIMTSGATLNWGELISSNLDNQLKKLQKRTSILHVHISDGCNMCQHGVPFTWVEMVTKSIFSSCLL